MLICIHTLKVKSQVNIAPSALEACIGAEGIVIATEWDEFKTLDWQAIYDSMAKPAFVFGKLKLLKDHSFLHKKRRSIG